MESPRLWIGNINIVKMSILYNTNGIFTEMEKLKTILVFMWTHRRTQISKATLNKRYKAGCMPLIDFKVYYKATIIQSGYWHTKRHISQWNRIESPGTNVCFHDHLIFNQVVKDTQWGKDSIISKWWRKNWMPTCRRVELDPYLTLH